MTPAPAAEPPADCPICPRLVAYRRANQAANPGWFNGAVPGWGGRDAPFLVVGMAPGVRGANRTGRPFTGDQAGLLLFGTLLRFGFARGRPDAGPGDGSDDGPEDGPDDGPEDGPKDGMVLDGCRVVNAVRCVPPKNLPEPGEVRNCNPFLAAEFASMPALREMLVLGVLAHNAALRALGLKPSRHPFKHGNTLELEGGCRVTDCYHVSRYNTNTGVLTTPMFEAVIAGIAGRLGRDPGLAEPSVA